MWSLSVCLKMSYCTISIAGIHWTKGWFMHVPGGMERDGARFHHNTQKSMQCKIYELFISGIFYLIFSDHSWLWITENAKSKTVDKGMGDCNITQYNTVCVVCGCVYVSMCVHIYNTTFWVKNRIIQVSWLQVNTSWTKWIMDEIAT